MNFCVSHLVVFGNLLTSDQFHLVHFFGVDDQFIHNW